MSASDPNATCDHVRFAAAGGGERTRRRYRRSDAFDGNRSQRREGSGTAESRSADCGDTENAALVLALKRVAEPTAPAPSPLLSSRERSQVILRN